MTSHWLSVVGLFATLSVTSVVPSLVRAESPILAPTLPMSWNSWD